MIWLLIVCGTYDVKGSCLPVQRFETKQVCEFVGVRYKYTATPRAWRRDGEWWVSTTCTGIPRAKNEGTPKL